MIPVIVKALLAKSPKEWVQFGNLLLDLLPDALALWNAWRLKHGQRLTPAARKALVGELRAAVAHAKATKDTSRLEALFLPRPKDDA